MKRLIFALLFISSTVMGQGIAYTNTSFRNESFTTSIDTTFHSLHHRKIHCAATITGQNLMIAGGSMIVLGGIIIRTKPFYNRNNLFSEDLAGGIFLGFGLVSLLVGGATFGCGNLYEHHHKERFSLIGAGNQVGLAYNF